MRETHPGICNPSFSTDRSMYNSAIFIIKGPGGVRVWWGQMQTELSIAQTLFLVREMEAGVAVRAALF